MQKSPANVRYQIIDKSTGTIVGYSRKTLKGINSTVRKKLYPNLFYFHGESYIQPLFETYHNFLGKELEICEIVLKNNKILTKRISLDKQEFLFTSGIGSDGSYIAFLGIYKKEPYVICLKKLKNQIRYSVTPYGSSYFIQESSHDLDYGW